MNFGEMLEMAAVKNLSATTEKAKEKNPIQYLEYVHDGKFKIELISTEDKNAYIHCELPGLGTEPEKNYLRMYFLSMVYNAAIYGMKKQKSFKKKRL